MAPVERRLGAVASAFSFAFAKLAEGDYDAMRASSERGVLFQRPSGAL
ncbi:hypothetical protein [Baekduia sp.]|nr:hypothetical protein [Baekduia sp.]